MKDKELQKSILQQLIIAVVIAIPIYLIIDGASLLVAMFIGLLIWCTVLVTSSTVRNLWFIWPKANFAIVLEKGMTATEKLNDSQLTNMQPTEALRVVWGPKLTGKSPFEKPLDGNAINLKRSIGIGETLTIKLKDNSIHKIKWWTVLSVIHSDEAVKNLARHTEKQAIERYTRNFSSFLQGECARIENTDRLYEQIIPVGVAIPGQPRPMGELQKKFNQLYGGSGVVVPSEVEIGFQTGDPLCEIELEKSLMDAFQASTVAAQKAKAIAEYTKAGVGVHPDIAANMVSIDAGKEKPATVTRQIFDLPPGIKNVSIIPITETRN